MKKSISIRLNISANLVGNAWSGIAQIAVLPIFLRYLGPNGFGVIGVFNALLGWLTLLDFGLGPTLNREMARFREGTRTTQEIHDLVRSMAVIFVVAAALISAGTYMASPWLAVSWLGDRNAHPGDLVAALQISGVVIALRLVGGLYRSGITGLQSQVILNVSNIVFATLRTFGAVAVLAFVSATAECFLLFQGAVALAETIVLLWMLRKLLPVRPMAARIRFDLLVEVLPFARGMLAIALLSTILLYFDKVLLAKRLPLQEFGYYMLAASVTGGLSVIILPIATAVGPRMAQLVAAGEVSGLTGLYHRSAQLLSVMLIGPTLLLACFSNAVIFAWTGNKDAMDVAAPVLTLLALGTLCNGWMNMPYMLQLAYGRTGVAIAVNIVAVAIFIPTLVVVTRYIGAMGAALIWLLLNAAYVAFAAPLMQRRLLRTTSLTWYIKDIFCPLVPAAIVAIGLSHAVLLNPVSESRVATGVTLVAIGVVITLISAIATELGRQGFARACRLVYGA